MGALWLSGGRALESKPRPELWGVLEEDTFILA